MVFAYSHLAQSPPGRPAPHHPGCCRRLEPKRYRSVRCKFSGVYKMDSDEKATSVIADNPLRVLMVPTLPQPSNNYVTRSRRTSCFRMTRSRCIHLLRLPRGVRLLREWDEKGSYWRNVKPTGHAQRYKCVDAPRTLLSCNGCLTLSCLTILVRPALTAFDDSAPLEPKVPPW